MRDRVAERTRLPATGIEEVLKRVGVPRGSFHDLFPSRLAFGEAAILNHVDSYARKAGWIFDNPERSPLDRLRVFADDARVKEIRTACFPMRDRIASPTGGQSRFVC